MERVAQPFADMMGQMAANITGEYNADLYDFGFYMGKWLYVIDAYADVEHDIKHKNYNPFVMAHPENTKQEAKESLQEIVSQ